MAGGRNNAEIQKSFIEHISFLDLGLEIQFFLIKNESKLFHHLSLILKINTKI
jgi:hypothetical protein